MRCLFLLSLLVLPLFVRASSYDFPYRDPFYATVTAAILKADPLDTEADYRDLNLRLLPERNRVPFYGEYRNHIKLRLWAQKEEAPLIVMVAGLGGAHSSSYYNYLGYQFFKRGYHVLTFPSPFHWSFALAASTSGYPGITRQDSEDLYRAIGAGLNLARGKGVKIRSLGLIGVSMGALESAYLSEIDSRRSELNFSRILLINPPVDPLKSAANLDALSAEGDSFSPEQKKNLQENVYLFGIKAMVMNDIKDPNYFLHVEKELPITLPERRFLIGNSLRDFLEALIFTTQQVRDLSVLKSPVATDNPDARLAESRGFSYTGYMEKFLLPALGVSYEQVANDVNMSGVEEHLRRDERVFLMHNKDDFILNAGEIQYLQGVFGSRMRTYPYGGHVGNIWYPENLSAILSTFEGL
jgi:hypothetical protein